MKSFNIDRGGHPCYKAPDLETQQTSLDACLEPFADRLEADLQMGNLTLGSAIIVGTSLNALADLLEDFSQRNCETISQSNLSAEKFTTLVQSTTLPRGAIQYPQKVHTPQTLYRKDTYFADLSVLAGQLRLCATGLLAAPTAENFKAIAKTVSTTVASSTLRTDTLLFEIGFICPLENFIKTIDFQDNRDRTSLRAETIRKLAQVLPTTSAGLIHSIESGPLYPQSEQLAEALEQRAA